MPEAAAQRKVYGVLAEFADTGPLKKAAEEIHAAGFKKWDAYSPFPIHGMDGAMGLKRSPIGFIVGIFATTGLALFTGFLYWMNVIDYPIVISGKPFFSYQAFVPPMFAITILSAALSAMLGFLGLTKLPRYNHPLFNSKEFEKVTDGGFFISVEAEDDKFDRRETAKFLESLGAKYVEVVMEDEETAE
jgi:hypothetical protein